MHCSVQCLTSDHYSDNEKVDKHGNLVDPAFLVADDDDIPEEKSDALSSGDDFPSPATLLKAKKPLPPVQKSTAKSKPSSVPAQAQDSKKKTRSHTT